MKLGPMGFNPVVGFIQIHHNKPQGSELNRQGQYHALKEPCPMPLQLQHPPSYPR